MIRITKIFAYTTIFAISLFIFTSCDSSPTLSSEQSDNAVGLYKGGPTSTEACGPKIWFPESDTQIRTSKGIHVNDDGSYSFESGSFDVSSRYRLIAKTEQGDVTGIETVSPSEGIDDLWCECKDSGQETCDVWVNPEENTASCSLTECSDCTMHIEGSGSTSVEGLPAGYIRTPAQIDFVSYKGNLSYPPAFSAMFKLKEVKQALGSFLERVAGSKTPVDPIETPAGLKAPRGTAFAPIRVADRRVFVALPSSELSETILTSSQLDCNGALCRMSSSSLESPVIVSTE